MPYKEKEIEKVYFTIGEVAEKFNVATSLIRFWETEFDILSPKKNKKGNRQFTRSDIQKLQLIYHLVKERGFTLQGAKEMLQNDPDDLQGKMEMIESLQKVKGFLSKLKEEL
ncbi:MAG: MerR family transcriptional regulator [Bacteroidota bacterium]